VAESPEEIYGKVMSIPDSLIINYFELVTDVPDKELEEFRQGLADKTINPMGLKKRLGREIITQLYDQKAATDAEGHFERTVQRKEMPEEIPEVILSSGLDLRKALVAAHLAKSGSEASRLLEQGAVEIDGRKMTLTDFKVRVRNGNIIKVGKRRFARVIIKD